MSGMEEITISPELPGDVIPGGVQGKRGANYHQLGILSATVALLITASKSATALLAWQAAGAL
eukprot:6450235-Amphidinium_carterae.1